MVDVGDAVDVVVADNQTPELVGRHGLHSTFLTLVLEGEGLSIDEILMGRLAQVGMDALGSHQIALEEPRDHGHRQGHEPEWPHQSAQSVGLHGGNNTSPGRVKFVPPGSDNIRQHIGVRSAGAMNCVAI